MSTMAAKRDTKGAARKWVALVDRLLLQIEKWTKEKHWQATRLEPKTLSESAIGTYSVSDLRIRTNSGVLDVAAVARCVSGAEGRVDLVAFPTMDRFMLIRTGGKWVVETDLGFRWPRKWGKPTFIELARMLTRAS